MKLFVQGDRNAEGIADLAERIAKVIDQLRVEMEIILNLGAYGQLVRIFLDAGCEAVCHGHRKNDRGNCPEQVTFIDCSQEESREKAWGKRMGLLLESDAFLFFKGSEGTLAHLFPALAFAKKHGKRVALVGWPIEQETAIELLIGAPQDWLKCYQIDADPAEIVGFLVNA